MKTAHGSRLTAHGSQIPPAALLFNHAPALLSTISPSKEQASNYRSVIISRAKEVCGLLQHLLISPAFHSSGKSNKTGKSKSGKLKKRPDEPTTAPAGTRTKSSKTGRTKARKMTTPGPTLAPTFISSKNKSIGKKDPKKNTLKTGTGKRDNHSSEEDTLQHL